MHNTAHITSVPEIPVAAPRIRGRETLIRAGAALWRVQDRDGRLLGHLRHLEHPLGVRFRAERLHLPTGRFLQVGEFWCADEAVASLRA
ncbi:hypothetical protein [Microbacterium sp. NPDC096154]|uniref:hypothetical protein n=1 Tax=Microbacterium sp. NPDC096154 TaxID=3155549 RepID=UPI00331DB2C2